MATIIRAMIIAAVNTNGIVRLIIHPSSLSMRPLVMRRIRQVGTGKRIPITQPLPPLMCLVGDRYAAVGCTTGFPRPFRCPRSPRRDSEPLTALMMQRTKIVRSGTSPKQRIFAVAWGC